MPKLTKKTSVLATSDAPKAAAAPRSSFLQPIDPVAQGAHGDQEPRGHEPVHVDDPKELGARGLEVRTEGRHRQVQHGEVHRVEPAGERDHGQPGPPAGPGPRRVVGQVPGALTAPGSDRSPLKRFAARVNLGRVKASGIRSFLLKPDASSIGLPHTPTRSLHPVHAAL
jgi:hypothetical protein